MSIRKKLSLLLLVVGLVPTLVVSFVAYIIISNELTDRTVDQLASTAIKQEQKINGLLQTKQEEVVKLSNRFDLQSALGSYLSNKDDANRQAINSILLKKKVEVPDIQAIYLADLEGGIIGTTNGSDPSIRLAPEDYERNNGTETVTYVKEDERDGIIKLYITTKVSVNKQDAGYLNMIFRIDDIIAAIQDYTGLGATGETVVVSKNDSGDAVTLFPLRFDTDAALDVNLNSLSLFEHIGAPYRDVKDYRGESVMVAPRAVGFADWVIATKMDQSEALAPINQLRDTLILIVLILSAATVVIALYLTRFFTDPILRIAQAARLIGEGDLAARVDISRTDEIGALSNSINTMGHNLKALVTDIESQRNQLEIILNSTAESILAIDERGVIRIANQSTAELAQMGLHELIGRNIKDVFAWRHDLQPFAVDYNVDGTKTYFDLQYTNPAGVVHYVKLIVARARNDQDGTLQIIVTIHDETKSRELENMKIDFVSMAAHELRTPLAAIRGYLELITYKGKENITSDVEKYLKQALQSTAELGALINNLLNVTRIERGTLTFHLEKVDLAKEVRLAVEDVKFGAEDKHIDLTYEGPANGELVAADQIALREVITNLISNAVKYTDAGGHVNVNMRDAKDHYTVSVKDTGIGIPEQALPNLFTKFFRAHSGLNSGNPGTGLGLFIAKSIIERHKGTITVQSKEGVGSVFTFTIPKWNDETFAELQAGEQKSESKVRRHRGWVTKEDTSR